MKLTSQQRNAKREKKGKQKNKKKENHTRTRTHMLAFNLMGCCFGINARVLGIEY